MFLVARPETHDPFFEKSVVLMLPSDNTPLVVGLIVNKPTRVPLLKLFPDSPALQKQTLPAYFGGPVEIRVPSLVFRSPMAPDRSLRLYGDVYLTFDSDLIKSVFHNEQAPAKLRLFLGRAQWAPGQLQNEILRGGWYRVPAEGSLIFSADPQSLWSTLFHRARPDRYIQYWLHRVPPPRTATSL